MGVDCNDWSSNNRISFKIPVTFIIFLWIFQRKKLLRSRNTRGFVSEEQNVSEKESRFIITDNFLSRLDPLKKNKQDSIKENLLVFSTSTERKCLNTAGISSRNGTATTRIGPIDRADLHSVPKVWRHNDPWIARYSSCPIWRKLPFGSRVGADAGSVKLIVLIE